VIAREIFQRIKNYLVYRVAVTYQLLMFFFLCIFAFVPADYGFEDADAQGVARLPNYFNLPVLGLVIIVILNDFSLISIAYDNVVASSIPETWTLKVTFATGVVIGSVAVCGQMTLLYLLFDAHGKTGFLSEFTYSQIIMAMWLALSLLDFYSVFAARCASGFFFSRAPSLPLLSAACFAMFVSTLLATTWPFNAYSEGVEMDALNANQALFVWAYCTAWFLAQDLVKWCFYRFFLFMDFEGIQTSLNLRDQRAAEIARSLEESNSKHDRNI